MAQQRTETNERPMTSQMPDDDVDRQEVLRRMREVEERLRLVELKIEMYKRRSGP